jgi:hypothetical protein
MDSSTYFTVQREANATNFIFNLSKTKVSLGMKTGGWGVFSRFQISVSFSYTKFENSGTSSREKKARRKKCKIIAGIAIFLTILLYVNNILFVVNVLLCKRLIQQTQQPTLPTRGTSRGTEHSTTCQS